MLVTSHCNAERKCSHVNVMYFLSTFIHSAKLCLLLHKSSTTPAQRHRLSRTRTLR